MQKTTILSAVMALVAFEARALQIEEELPETFVEHWRAVKGNYAYGNGVGKYDKKCIKSAERYWYNANKKWCPNKGNERAMTRCYAETTERY